MEHIVLLLLLVTAQGSNDVLQAEVVQQSTTVADCTKASHAGFKAGAVTPQPTRKVSAYCVDVTAGTSVLVDTASNPAELNASGYQSI